MIKIVTDSSSDIPPSVAAALGITVVPVRISFGAKVFYDGVDIDRTTFNQYLTRSMVLPTAAPPSAEEFQQVYSGLLGSADQILSIHTSSRLSKTAQVAQEAAKAFLGRSKITVVDSRMISWGLEVLVRAAAEAARSGAGMEETVRMIRGMIPHIYMVFFVETLDFLDRHSHSGRGRVLGDSLPGARPLLIMEDGEILPLERVRARGKPIERLFEFVAEFARFEQAVILHGRASEDTQQLFQHLTDAFRDKKLDIRPYGPAFATYLGPDALGVAVYEGA